MVDQPIGEFLKLLVEDLGIKDPKQKQGILNLESKFSQNFYYNTSQLSLLSEVEWETLKEFIPPALVKSIYHLLQATNEKAAN